MVVAAIDFEGGLENAWESIITFVPKLLDLSDPRPRMLIAKAIEKGR